MNDAFIISEDTKNTIIEKDPKSAELIRPILRGRDIKRYGYSFADLWLINTHNGIKSKNIPPVDVTQYPSIKEHLDKYYTQLAKRTDKGCTPYNLRNCVYMDDFYKQKIIFQEIVQAPSFAYDANNHFFCLDTGRIITGEHLKYLCAILNSDLFFFAMKAYLGGGTLGSTGVRMKHTFFEKFNCPIPDETTERRFDEILNIIEQKNKTLDSDLSDEIEQLNKMTYEIYHISSEEQLFIKNNI